jgi:uncharacterized SAM-binding protein YcdF (DUF218 family)
MTLLKNIVALFLTVFLAWGLGFAVFSGFALLAPPQEPGARTDAIIVLTGGNNRVHEGLALFAQEKSRNLFISGVNRDVTMGEIRRQWTGPGELPPCCITLGYEAASTRENAVETQAWARANHIRSLRLVTGNYHITRALLELRHTLPGVRIYINPVRQPDLPVDSRRLWFLMLVEYHKTLYRSLQLSFS